MIRSVKANDKVYIYTTHDGSDDGMTAKVNSVSSVGIAVTLVDTWMVEDTFWEKGDTILVPWHIVKYMVRAE